MTICLALVCENGKSLVAVADRMVSVESLSLEFEQGARKIEPIGVSFAALTAGDALAHTDLLNDAREEISGLSQPSVREVAEAVESCFTQHRQALAEKLVLRRVGLDYDAFMEKQQTLTDALVLGLSTEYREVELGVELLVGGVDSSGAHLNGISDPGIAECFDSIGYAAIGSGLPHAEGFLTEASYSPHISLSRAIWLSYVAKRRSERAPGVGNRFTDIMVIDSTGSIRFPDSAFLDNLNSIYKEYSNVAARAYQSIERSIDKFDLTFDDSEGGESNG